MKKLIFLFLIGISSLLSQTAVFPNAVVTDQQLGVAANGITGLLNNSVQVSDTSLNIKNGTCTANGISTTCNVAYKINMFVTIDSEIMRICSLGSATGVTILNLGSVTVGSSCPSISGRGLDGTQIAAHSTITANACNSAGTGCVRNNIIAWNNNAKNKEIEAIEAKNRDVISYGADSTGVADSLVAFNLAKASGNPIRVPAGLFRVSDVFSMQVSNMNLICESSASIIEYTGTTNIVAVVQAGSLTADTNRINVLGGCTILGNSHTTQALLVNKMNHGVYENIAAGNSDGTTPAKCITAFNGHTNTFLHPYASGPTSGGGAHNCLQGLNLEDEIGDKVISLQMEGVTNEGLIIQHTTGNGCGGNSIDTGVSEAVGTGISISTFCTGNHITNVDVEVASVTSIVDSGSTNMYTNMSSNYHFTSTAVGNIIFGGIASAITIDAGAKNLLIVAPLLCQTAGSLIDNGTNTTIIYPGCSNGNSPFPTQFSGAGFTIQAGFNRVLDTGANNAIAGVFSPPSAHGSLPVACPPFLNQQNDMMPFFVKLAHSLQVGANTFNFCSLGATPIKKHSNPAANLTTGYAAGVLIHLVWDYDNQVFVDMGQ